MYEHELLQATIPEIQRSSFATAVLHLKTLDCGDFKNKKEEKGNLCQAHRLCTFDPTAGAREVLEESADRI